MASSSATTIVMAQDTVSPEADKDNSDCTAATGQHGLQPRRLYVWDKGRDDDNLGCQYLFGESIDGSNGAQLTQPTRTADMQRSLTDAVFPQGKRSTTTRDLDELGSRREVLNSVRPAATSCTSHYFRTSTDVGGDHLLYRCDSPDVSGLSVGNDLLGNGQTGVADRYTWRPTWGPRFAGADNDVRENDFLDVADVHDRNDKRRPYGCSKEQREVEDDVETRIDNGNAGLDYTSRRALGHGVKCNNKQVTNTRLMDGGIVEIGKEKQRQGAMEEFKVAESRKDHAPYMSKREPRVYLDQDIEYRPQRQHLTHRFVDKMSLKKDKIKTFFETDTDKDEYATRVKGVDDNVAVHMADHSSPMAMRATRRADGDDSDEADRDEARYGMMLVCDDSPGPDEQQQRNRTKSSIKECNSNASTKVKVARLRKQLSVDLSNKDRRRFRRIDTEQDSSTDDDIDYDAKVTTKEVSRLELRTKDLLRADDIIAVMVCTALMTKFLEILEVV